MRCHRGRKSQNGEVDGSYEEGTKCDPLELVLKSFPECLQADICLHLNKTLLNDCPLFRNASPGCLRALSMKFKSLHAPTGDTLIHPGDVIDSLYFVTRGSIEILKEDIIMAILGKDDIFGKDVRHLQSSSEARKVSKSAFSVRAMSYAEMHRISLDDLQAIFGSYPDFACDFVQKFEATFDIELDTNLCISDKVEETVKFLEVRRRKSQNQDEPKVVANGFHKFVRDGEEEYEEEEEEEEEEAKKSTPRIVEESSQHSTLSKIESLQLERNRDTSTSLDYSRPDRTASQIGTSKSPSSSIRTVALPRLPRVSELPPVVGDALSDEGFRLHGEGTKRVSPSSASYAPKSSFSTAGMPSSCSLPAESDGASDLCARPEPGEEQQLDGIPVRFLKDVDSRLKKINRRMGKFENELSSTIDAILKALGYNPPPDKSQGGEQAQLSTGYFAYRSGQYVPGVYGSTHLLGVSPVIHEPPLMSP